jgi:hypothetical protein
MLCRRCFLRLTIALGSKRLPGIYHYLAQEQKMQLIDTLISLGHKARNTEHVVCLSLEAAISLKQHDEGVNTLLLRVIENYIPIAHRMRSEGDSKLACIYPSFIKKTAHLLKNEDLSAESKAILMEGGCMVSSEEINLVRATSHGPKRR